MYNGFPRRSIIEQQLPQETAIRAAIEEVEALGAHPLLTDAVILLSQAQEKVADYFDSCFVEGCKNIPSGIRPFVHLNSYTVK